MLMVPPDQSSPNWERYFDLSVCVNDGGWSSFTGASALLQLPAGASTLRFTVLNGTQYNIANISLTPAATPSKKAE